ncbi:MAG: IS200/IS605 family transposase [Oscillospiraceae bacterium]|nr:IS200/IS605 family transposase [Oscillospiraceae bacterium]
MDFKTNKNIMYSCKYHIVWCPKYRRKVLRGNISERLKELIKEKCSEIGVDIIEMEIQPDHVHLLIEADPRYGVNKAIKLIKGYTSHMLRKEFAELTTKLPTLWTNSYFISTVGGEPVSAMKRYIESQAKSQREEGKRATNVNGVRMQYV